jgi:hypothetical protein
MIRQPVPVISSFHDGVSQQMEIAANPCMVLGEQSIFVQFTPTGNNAANNQYPFSNCSSSAANGIRVNYALGGGFGAFGADSATATQPSRAGTVALATGNFYTWCSSWDGSVTATNIHNYLSINAGGLATNDGTATNGTGSINLSTNQPSVIGGRTGGVARNFFGYLFRITRWSRILTADEFARALNFGPQSVAPGLITLDWANGRDWSQNHLLLTTATAVVQGVSSPFPSPFRRQMVRFAHAFTPSAPAASLNRPYGALLG